MYSQIRQNIIDAVKKNFLWDPNQKILNNIVCEPCRNQAHGDITCNFLMVTSNTIEGDRELVESVILNSLSKNENIANVSIAKPGFINIKFHTIFWQKQLEIALDQGLKYGLPNLGQGEKVLIEFVSTNPTGPIHIGHGRNAVLGDSISRMLASAGYNVTKEYYINDAGNQIINLAKSLYLRYLEQIGYNIDQKDFSDDMYPGQYLIPIAETIVEKYGKKFENQISQEETINFFKEYAVDNIMENIKDDLKKIDIEMNSFCKETDLIKNNVVQKAMAKLKKQDDLYEGVIEQPKDKNYQSSKEKLTIFKATKYKDDKDRVVIKSDHTYTYFANDIGYHYEKFNRGYKKLVNVLGADHIGYIKRLTAATQAVTNSECFLHIIVCQLVNFLKNGKPLRMSKRAGTFVTMSDIIDEIGVDAFRFMLLTRRSDVGFDFDVKQVLEKSKENPVFYVQYAYARIASVKRRSKTILTTCLEKENVIHLLTDVFELSIIKLIVDWPRQFKMAVTLYEPHRIANYLYELASQFHGFWTQGYKIVDETDPNKTKARLKLLQAIQNILKIGLNILGINAFEEM